MVTDTNTTLNDDIPVKQTEQQLSEIGSYMCGDRHTLRAGIEPGTDGLRARGVDGTNVRKMDAATNQPQELSRGCVD